MTKSSPHLPGPSGWPLLGNLPELGRDPLTFLTGLRDRYGDVARFSYGREAVLLSHPDHVEQALLGTGRTFRKGYQAGFSMPLVLGNGLVTSEHDFWRGQRRLMQPVFHAQRVSAFAETMVAYARDLRAEWHDGRAVDVHADMMLLTQRIIARTLFDADVRETARDVGRDLEVVLHEMGAEMTSLDQFLPNAIPTPARRRLRAATARVDAVLHDIISRRRERGDDHPDLLGMLLAARDDHGQAMPDRQLRDEVMTLYIAGHETTANTLTWTWWLLDRHPEVREKLEAELDAVLAGRDPTVADLKALTYTDAVIREALRLVPPVWVVSRLSEQEVTLGGHRLPANTEVWLSPWVTQRDARWYADPDAYRPERWLDGSTAGNPKHAFFPFGGGPRVCIGISFAQMEAVLLLATLASRARVEDTRPDTRMDASVTIRPRGGLPGRVRHRHA